MKAIFIAYNQAYYFELVDLLEKNGVRGFTEWDEIKGRGTETGEAHYGSHAWPTLNNAILTFVPDDKVESLMNQLHERDLKTEGLGLKAAMWNIESII